MDDGLGGKENMYYLKNDTYRKGRIQMRLRPSPSRRYEGPSRPFARATAFVWPEPEFYRVCSRSRRGKSTLGIGSVQPPRIDTSCPVLRP